jgi:hypothetical protein
MAISTPCLPNNLISPCFQENVINDQQRLALTVFFMVQELAALGGDDYTAELTGNLLTDATVYKTMDDNQVKTAILTIMQRNATAAGATPPTDIQELSLAIDCLINTPTATLEREYLLLLCKLGQHHSQV